MKEDRPVPAKKPLAAGGGAVRDLKKEIARLQRELEEANEALRAIRHGEVDALVVSTLEGEKVFTLQGADHPYRIFVEKMSGGAVTFDPEGLIVFCNRRFAEIVGVPMEKVVGARMSEFISDSDRPAFDGWMAGVLDRGDAEREVTLRHASGAPVPALLSAGVLPGQDPPSYSAVVWDLTERKRAEDLLRESEERFRTLVEDSLTGFLLVQGGRIVYMNQEQKRILGMGIAEGEEISAFRHIHPDDLKPFLRLCDASDLTEWRGGSVEIRLHPPVEENEGEEIRWVHCRTSGVRYEGEDAALVNMVDVTSIKRMEQLWNAQERLVSLGQIAAGIAHEIRNPLSGFTLALSTFEKVRAQAKGLERRDREALEKACLLARSSSERIDNIVRKVKSLGKSSPSSVARSDVKRCVEGMVPFLAPDLTREGIEIRANLRGDLPGCRIDAALLDQVLVNIVNNAAQALEGATGIKVIEISAAVEDRFLVVSVSDSGPGVPPGMRERIFDPFFSTRHCGVGIGLSFSRKVVAGQGGFIRVGTSPLGGARFRIGIPVADGPASAAAPPADLEEKRTMSRPLRRRVPEIPP